MDLNRVIELAGQIAQECETDSRDIDQTPFTGKGVGQTFGTILANHMALAKEIEGLAKIVRNNHEPSISA